MTDTTIEADYEESEYSRDLQISSAGHEKIQKLKDLPGSTFADADMKEVYVMAAAYGFQHDRIAAADATGSRGVVGRKALSDDQVAVMEAIAVDYEGSPMVLKDQETVATIAQRFALGGLDALIDHYETADKPREELISEIAVAR